MMRRGQEEVVCRIGVGAGIINAVKSGDNRAGSQTSREANFMLV